MIKDPTIQRFWRHIKSFRQDFRSACVFSILNRIFDIAPPILIGLAVDIVVKRQQSFLANWGIKEMMPQLLTLSGITALVWVLESYFEYLLNLRWKGLAQKVQHELRMDTYDHVQKLDLKYFEDKQTGDLIAVLNDDINQLELFLNRGVSEILQVFTSVVVIGGIFFYISPQVALVAFLPIPVIIWASARFQRKIEPRYQKVRSESGLLAAILNNIISGAASVKAYTAQKHERGRIEKQSQVYSQANHWAISLSATFTPLIRMAILFAFITCLLFGGYLVEQGVIEISAYSVLIFIIQRLLWPLVGLSAVYDLLQRAKGSTARIFKVLDAPVEIKEGSKSLTLDQAPAVSFQKVNFSYSTGHPILKNLSLEVAAGKTIGLVGLTGSGKSTILKLLLRFYEGEEGSILINQENIKDFTLNSLRNQISLVSQETYLFHGSVYDNIAFGSPEKTQEEVISAAQMAQAHEFILSLPEGYDTLIGERGQKLSGGQRQRIAIARAILKDSPLFILDEATSAVDNETEAALQKSLTTITENRTTIIVAHRLSTIVHAHKIYVIDEGQVIEEGSHNHLLALKGQYALLWGIQTGNPLAATSQSQSDQKSSSISSSSSCE